MGTWNARFGLMVSLLVVLLLLAACGEQSGDGGLLVVYSDSSFFKEPVDTATVDSTRLDVFDALWGDVNTEYIFIDEKQDEWITARDEFRPQVLTSLNTREYRNLLANMLATMEDENLSLVDTSGNVFGTYNPFREPNWRRGAWDNTVGQFDITDNGEWGFMATDSFGYVFFRGFEPGEIDVAEFDAALDSLSEKRGLVIDMRFCGGTANTLTVPLLEQTSSQMLSEPFVGRFLSQPDTLLLHYTLDNPDPAPVVVNPRGDQPFSKPVAILMGLETMNEGELFSSAMGQLSNVTLIGDPTPGVATATEFYPLSPGWEYAIPKVAYVKMDNQLIQDNGLSPDYSIDWNNDSFNSVDEVLLDAFIWFGEFLDGDL